MPAFCCEHDRVVPRRIEAVRKQLERLFEGFTIRRAARFVLGFAGGSELFRIGIVIGEPLDFSRYTGLEDDRFVLRSVTDEIMYEIMRLSGQEYVDVYAATVKARSW